MAVPYLASRSGYVPLAVIATVAFCAALLLHLMVLEASLKAPDRQILSILDRFLFKGNKPLIYTFFSLIAIGALSNLAAYVIGGAAVTEGWGIPVPAGAAAFYGICALIVLLGIKSVGIGEKAAMAGMIGITVYIAAVSFGGGVKPVMISGSWKEWTALYGMLMFCLGAYFAVPQVVAGLRGDAKGAAKAVVLGMGINLVITLAIALFVMRVDSSISAVAIVGWSEEIGGISGAMGSVFVWLAMATSYWSTSYALKDILVEQLNLKSHTIAWLIATLPSLLLLFVSDSFIELLKLAGGATALILMFTLIPAFRNSRKQEAAGWSLGKLGGTLPQLAVAIAYAVMAIASLLPVE